MKIVNWNTKVCDQSQADVIATYLDDVEVDIACLQEVGNNSDLSKYLDALPSNDWHVASAPEGYGGKNYYIIINKSTCSNISPVERFDPRLDPENIKLKYLWSSTLFDQIHGRSPIYLELSHGGEDYRIANWHAPINVHTPGELSKRLKGGSNLESMIGVETSMTFNPTMTPKRIILAGDLNIKQQELEENWQQYLVDIQLQYKSGTKPKFMKRKTLFDEYLDITPSRNHLEHILVSYDVDFDIHVLWSQCSETINNKQITNKSDHSLMYVTLEDA
ncbi:exonuclease/endonuclease/phosphatase family protein [Ectopseudomonas khazarica]|uniref:endonuclease/exonuclease/phosphatase family protein n=1 Tax=Ectopseudomonas khazarica TaxID=2502979 RepID=UPI00106E0355|nr:endonuclease/exonuclease/phosphatase family protein [Pseudomonas khazarica]